MAWTDRYADFVATKRGLAAALHSGDQAYNGLPQRLLDRLEPALHLLLARAIDAGVARDDIRARDALTAIALLCQPVPIEDPNFNRCMVELFVEGLRRPADGDLPHEPPSCR